jgi:hypothetical protein
MFDIFPYSTTNKKIMHLLVVREHLCVLLLAQRGFMLFGCWIHPNISSVEAILLFCSGDVLSYFWEVNASVGVNLKAQEELWKLKYFTMLKHNLQKKFSKRNQNPSRYYNSRTSLKFQHKPKYIIFQTSSYKNRPISSR